MQAPDALINAIISERWKILGCLGEGKMSFVYKAQDINTGKIIVLKKIKESLLKDIDDLENLAKQAKAFIALNHENIASYYDIDLNEKGLFLFCDYLNGESLSSLLNKVGKLPLDKSVKLLLPIATGLAYAHEKKIFHGNIKLSNIYIVNDEFNADEPKIVDFGFVNLIENLRQKKHLKDTNEAVNVSYLSPEQRMGKNISEVSDLYSLGCLMFEIASGKSPFSSKTLMETTYKQKHLNPNDLQQLLPRNDLLDKYQVINNKLLSPNNKQRYRSAPDLEHDLKLLNSNKGKEWQKKAYALKKPSYVGLTLTQWRLAFISLLLGCSLYVFILLAQTLWPYYSSWQNKFFDDNKLWIIKSENKENIPAELQKQKHNIENKLNGIKQSQGMSSDEYLDLLFYFAKYLIACGDFTEAKNKLYELQNTERTKVAIDQADLLSNIALVQNYTGEKSAEKTANMALETGAKGESKILALKVLGDIYSENNEFQKAEEMYKQMYLLCKNNKLKNPAEYAYSTALLADTLRIENRLKEAEQLYKASIDWACNYIGQNRLFTAKAHYGLALVYLQEQKWHDADLQSKQALEIAKSKLRKGNKYRSAIESLNDYILFHSNIADWLKSRLSSSK